MKKTKGIIAVLLLCALAPALCSCAALGKAAELQSYELGDDSIPSVNSVVGQREVTGVETNTGTDGQVEEYSYASDAVFDDLVAYIEFLANEDGWQLTEDLNLSVVPGSTQLGKESVDAGKILLVSISYDDAGYTINAAKAKGTLTAN